jgi:hypothetical protein
MNKIKKRMIRNGFASLKDSVRITNSFLVLEFNLKQSQSNGGYKSLTETLSPRLKVDS